MQKFEIVRFGPYRFMGKSVYARAGMKCGDGNFAGFLWENFYFDELDELKKYATDYRHNAALLTWNKYDAKINTDYTGLHVGPTNLLGYTIGRFMKVDTPTDLVHFRDGLDYFDIPETYVAIGTFDKETGNEEGLVKNAISEQGECTVRSDKFMVEMGLDNGFCYIIACDKKE